MRFRGPYLVIIVSKGDVVIDGMVDISADGEDTYAGGAPGVDWPSHQWSDGLGPGGGSSTH